MKKAFVPPIAELVWLSPSDVLTESPESPSSFTIPPYKNPNQLNWD